MMTALIISLMFVMSSGALYGFSDVIPGPYDSTVAELLTGDWKKDPVIEVERKGSLLTLRHTKMTLEEYCENQESRAKQAYFILGCRAQEPLATIVFPQRKRHVPTNPHEMQFIWDEEHLYTSQEKELIAASLVESPMQPGQVRTIECPHKSLGKSVSNRLLPKIDWQ